LKCNKNILTNTNREETRLKPANREQAIFTQRCIRQALKQKLCICSDQPFFDAWPGERNKKSNFFVEEKFHPNFFVMQ
jgi:hypothetical protein